MQSVKKVAEYLKSNTRIEVEKHSAAKPRDLATAYGGMAPLFQSDALEMVAATISPGASLMLDPVDNRELLVSRGTVTVTTLKSSVPLAAGQRMDLAQNLPTMLVNPGTADVEVILMTMLGGRTAAETRPYEVRPMVLHA